MEHLKAHLSVVARIRLVRQRAGNDQICLVGFRTLYCVLHGGRTALCGAGHIQPFWGVRSVSIKAHFICRIIGPVLHG